MKRRNLIVKILIIVSAVILLIGMSLPKIRIVIQRGEISQSMSDN